MYDWESDLSFCIFRSRCLPPPERRLCADMRKQTGIRPLLLSATLHPISWRGILLAAQCSKRNSRWFIFFRATKKRTHRCLSHERRKRRTMKLNTWISCAEAEENEATNLIPIKNKTFNDESRSQTSPGLPTDETNANEDFGAGSESDPFTDKMVSGNSEPLKANNLEFFPF